VAAENVRSITNKLGKGKTHDATMIVDQIHLYQKLHYLGKGFRIRGDSGLQYNFVRQK